MNTQSTTAFSLRQDLYSYALLSALKERRSRRFGLGMKMESGPFAYESRHQPCSLSEEEEAALAFAACGITGPVLGDLSYAAGQGGNIMAGLVGRTIASGDAIQTVALIVINDSTTYLIKRPQDFDPAEISEMVELGSRDAFTELYRRSRIKIKDGRAASPMDPPMNLNVNRWALHAPGTTYFLPINDLTLMYLNGLLEIFNEETAVFVLDERNHYLPAGVGKFAKRRGGHLEDDPRRGLVVTVRHVEQLVTEFVTVEQGMMLQNLGLMTQALGLGGYPNFANHEFAWFEALGFRMGRMAASKYLGIGRFMSLAMRALGKDAEVPHVLGLECDGNVLLKPFCPPHYSSMSEAVDAVVSLKFGEKGIFRRCQPCSHWRDGDAKLKSIPSVSERAIAATKAYTEYLYNRYGRFPVYLTPYRTVLGYQAAHLDAEFYDKYYKPEALSQRQREDFEARVSA